MLIGELQEALDKKTFEKFNTPDSLHYLAQNWPWETKEEIEIVKWICQSDFCSLATAIMIFWLARPQDYTRYKLGSKIPYDDGVFEIIQLILDNIQKGKYSHYGINYDPRNDMPQEQPKIDERMKAPINGEDAWYDDDYIRKISWYTPGELKTEIKSCSDNIYLNMMANGLDNFKYVSALSELIIGHPLCDKGTALLLYWRLLKFYYEGGFLPVEAEERIPVIKSIHEKLVDEFFNNGFEYTPLKDKENFGLLGILKKKWEIPEYMKLSV